MRSRLDFCYAKITINSLISNFLALKIFRKNRCGVNKKKHHLCPSGSIIEGLVEFVESVPEFRRTSKGNYRHKLSDILLLFIMGRACGCVGRTEIIEFGKHNLNKFQSMGRFINGIPSEPTLCRIENGMDEEELSRKMSDFENRYHEEFTKGQDPDIICIDGKAMRGTLQENGRNPDIVSAYSSSTALTLATEACKEKSN